MNEQQRHERRLENDEADHNRWEAAAKARKRKTAKPGRPNEGRVRVIAWVLPVTDARIDFLVDKSNRDQNTIGKVVDSQFGVQAGANVAGAGRKAPRGQHGRAKQKQSRAKRANDQAH